ncbi:hypothetical protein GCM10027344_36900 [Spelaeicoccus albus]
MHGDVEAAAERVGIAAPLDVRDLLGEPAGQRYPAGRNSEDDKVVGALIVLKHFESDASNGSADLCRVQNET